MTEFILTLSCPDRRGLVRVVSQWLFEQGCNIIDSDQFGDPYSQRFFMRLHFSGDKGMDELGTTFQPIAETYAMDWQLWPCKQKSRVLIMVSKLDHCLIDLVYRAGNGELPVDIALVASNHTTTEPVATAAGLEFLHAPVDASDKSSQEERLLREIDARGIDFVILARYMQILTPALCSRLPGRIINIHHSFLPSFKGARPYHRAHEHGVKLIGATAHYVTPDLDEGPIIEQGVERVDHRMTPAELAEVGRDIERMVLAKAVRYQAEHRVLLNENKTVVFR